MIPLLTLGEVATYLGVPPSTIRYWRARGEGPPVYKIGRVLRYDPAEVRAWQQAQRLRTPTCAPETGGPDADSIES